MIAAEPFLVAEINSGMRFERGLGPMHYRSLGDVAVFTATDPAHGRELWASDGTGPGTKRIADICPRHCSLEMRPLWVSNGLFYFNAVSEPVPSGRPDDARQLRKLWRTDGTSEGTVPLGDVRGVDPMGRLPATGLEVFLGEDDGHGREPWVTDGTEAGTRLIRDVVPGEVGSGDVPVVATIPAAALPGHVLFTARSPDQGFELWRTDGTSQGTSLVRDIVPGIRSSRPTNLETLDDLVIFIAGDEEHGVELWRSDGTRAGTHVVRELAQGSGGAHFLEAAFFVDEKRAFFPAATATVPVDAPSEEIPLYQLWVTDGTATGTERLTAFASPFGLSDGVWDASLRLYPHVFMGSTEGTVFFVADDGVHGRELWVSDGTRAGTRQMADLCPGACSSQPRGFRRFGSVVNFTARTEPGRRELWVSDGTVPGTGLVADVCPGACGHFWTFREPLGEDLVVGASWSEGDADVPRLWKTGSSPGSGEEIFRWGTDRAFPGPVRGVTSRTAAIDGQILFTLNVGDHGTEIWSTRGTASSTRLLKELVHEESLGSHPRGLTTVGERAFFFASGEEEVELWVTDGTPPGSRQVAEFERNPVVDATLAGPTRIGDRFYFWHRPPLAGFEGKELWRSDGTAEGTERIATILDAHLPLEELDGRIFATSEEGLWRIDPSAGGAEQVEELDVGHGADLTRWRGELYFLARLPSPGSRRVLWKTDGTPGGAEELFGDAESEVQPSPGELTVVDDTLYFPVRFEGNRHELWASDGTVEGTRSLAELLPEGSLGGPEHFAAIPGTLVFVVSPLGADPVLWRSDGTPEGTVPIRTFPDSPDVLVTEFRFHRVGDRLLFFVDDEGPGLDLWRTDGSSAGTRRVVRIGGIPPGTELRTQEVVGDGLYFVAFTEGDGWQLWRADGTLGGTARLTDRSSGPDLASLGRPPVPQGGIAGAGDAVVFPARTPQVGTELWGLPLDAEPAGPPGEPPPPPGPWLTSAEVPGFRFKVRIAQGSGGAIAGTGEPDCIPETVCISGALPGRSEAFVRVVGPKPNGRLWPTLVKFSTSEVEIWIEQVATGAIRHYALEGVGPGTSALDGLFDREGFRPVGAPGAARGPQSKVAAELGASAEDPPPPPGGEGFTSDELPGFRFHVRITSGNGDPRPVRQEPSCIPETICVSGAVPGRSELFLRIVGPKPNGRLWPTLVRFTTSTAEVWIEQLSTGVMRYYRLEGVRPGTDAIPGLFDRDGFEP